MRYVNNSKADTEEKLNEIKNAGHIYLKVTCHDKSTGTAFDIGEDDVSMEGFQLTTILNPEVDIHYGEAISSEIQLNLLRTDDVSRIDWRDEITVSLGYEKNNNIIWDVIGTYYGNEPSQLYSKTKVITFIGYDKMTKYGQILADDLLSHITFPINNEDLMDELATQLGITITEEAPRLFQVLIYNDAIQTGATIRDILAWLAEVNGESAVKSVYADEVKFITYSKPKYNVDYTLTTDDYFTMDKSDVYVQSVPCLTFSDTANINNNYRYPPAATGVPYAIVNNPFFKKLDAADKDLVASMTLEYRLTFDANHDIPSFIPMKVDAIGNYMVEAGDVINIVDEDNNTLPLVIFSRTLTWIGGFLRDEYECTGGTERQEMSSTERGLYSVQKIIGNSISDNLVTNSKDMALSASQGKVLNDQLAKCEKKTLLWSTTSNSLAGQSLNIDTNGYDGFEVYTTNGGYGRILFNTDNTYAEVDTIQGVGTSSFYICVRFFYPEDNNTKIRFTDGKYTYRDGGNGTNNSLCSPKAIYGIKFG